MISLEGRQVYRYFIQPQLNAFTNSLIGYEMLIRKFVDGHWQLPKNFASIPIDEQVPVMAQTAKQLSLKIKSVSFNLNRTQFINPEMSAALIAAQKAIFPVNLIVEVTEEAGDNNVTIPQLKRQIRHFDTHGIQFSLDDVGTGINTYDHISSLLSLASEVKFAMQNYRRDHMDAKIHKDLTFWQDIAKKEQLRLIVEGIEDDDDDSMLDQMDVAYRQGYYYGQPHLFELKDDKKDWAWLSPFFDWHSYSNLVLSVFWVCLKTAARFASLWAPLHAVASRPNYEPVSLLHYFSKIPTE